MQISVCMATYNGEKYIKDQLESILVQLSADDEVIICDDLSSDETVKIIQTLNLNEPRIKLFQNEKRLRHVRNFEKALSLASGDVIFLADQDDIWPEKRVEYMLNALESGGVVVGNFKCFPHKAPYEALIETYSQNSLAAVLNILAGNIPYYGSAMCLSRSELLYLLPFPKGVEAHDLWIAINANIRGVMEHIPSLVLYRRLHDNNCSPMYSRGPVKIIKARFIMLKLILKSILQRYKLTG